MKNDTTETVQLKTIALDIGNVCIKIDPKRCFDALEINSSTEIPHKLMESIREMEEGKITEVQWLDVFQTVTHGRFSKNELRKAYLEILGEEIKGISDFIKDAVSKDIRLIFFSDISPIHINHIYRNLSFAHLVSGGIFSFEAGARKPDKKMYEEYERRYGKPLLYLDDKPENIAAGKDAGWNSVLFNGIESMEKDLLCSKT